MPDPCKYDDKKAFVSACVRERQSENPDEATDQFVAACIDMWESRDCKDKSTRIEGNGIDDASDTRGMIVKIHQEKPTRTADGRWTFVISSDAADRVKDIVRQSWSNLAKVAKHGIPALFGHSNTDVVGRWFSPRVEKRGSRLVTLMDLELLPPVTNDLVGTAHALVERAWLACSIGFYPVKYEYLEPGNRMGPWEMIKNELVECSLCAVGTNPDALPELRSLVAKMTHGKSPERLRAALDGIPDSINPGRASIQRSRWGSPSKPIHQLTSSGTSPDVSDSQATTRKAKMSLAEKIDAKKKALDDHRTRLTALMENSISDDGDFDEAISSEIGGLTDWIQKAENEIGILEKALKASVSRAGAVGGASASTVSAPPTDSAPLTDGAPPTDSAPAGSRTPVQQQPRQQSARIYTRKNRPAGHFVTLSLASLIKAHVEKQNPVQLVETALRDDPEVGIIVRAATSPASTTEPTWAGNLVRDSWGEFLELIRDMSIYPSLPGTTVEFGRFGRIPVPLNAGRGQLAATFVGQGDPAPVRAGNIGVTDLTPKSLKVISDFLKEIGMHSIPAIQQIITDQILGDTAEGLDTYYLDAGARDTVRPAGVQDTTETGAANINASTGNTVAAIIADTKAMIGRLLAARTGNGGVWIVNPLRVQGLMDVQDAASGQFVFRSELQAGTFRGYPTLSSENVTADVVTLQANSAMMYGNDYAPRIEISDSATLVYDDTAPEDIVSGGVATTQPVKSLFQTDGIAVKMTHGLDWRQVRANARQVLTGVGW